MQILVVLCLVKILVSVCTCCVTTVLTYSILMVVTDFSGAVLKYVFLVVNVDVETDLIGESYG